jgi:hypothetical protein
VNPFDFSFAQFTRLVIDALEAAEVTYMIGGSVGLLAWGEPRTTQDVDLVIDFPIERVYALSQALGKRGMLVPWETILDLLQQPEGDLPINAIHLDTGFKAELFLLRPDDQFRATAMTRRLIVELDAPVGPVYVQSPEDLIIYKLRYYQISQQTKHIRDIQSIFTAMGNELELAYLQRWIDHFNLSSAWHTVQRWPNPDA